MYTKFGGGKDKAQEKKLESVLSKILINGIKGLYNYMMIMNDGLSGPSLNCIYLYLDLDLYLHCKNWKSNFINFQLQ